MFFSKIIKYISDRFPSKQMIPLSIFLGSAASPELRYIPFACLFLYLYLFELRLIDEWKDYWHDKNFYPTRPVSRGLITLANLRLVLITNLAVQTILVIILNININIFILLQFYTTLMSFEFFAKNWLTKHFSIYIILHETVTPVLFLCITTIGKSSISRIAVLVSLVLAIDLFLLEIGRKLKPRTKNLSAKDTYVEVYGEKVVSIILMFLILFSYLLLLSLRINFYIYLVLFLPVIISILYKYWMGGWKKMGSALFTTLIAYVLFNSYLIIISKFMY